MQNFGVDKLVFSASDLANASDCLWAQVRRIDKALGFDIEVPKDEDPMLKRAGELGLVHEGKKLQEFKIKFGDGVMEIGRTDKEDKSPHTMAEMQEYSNQTLDALRSKKDVVFQATFFDGDFQGFADFIVKTDSGEYAVYDTKLARKAKITALIQLAAYADQLQKSGIPTSNQVHLILGDQSVSTHNLEDILPTYLHRRSVMASLIAERRANRDSGGSAIAWNDPTYSACGRCAVCEPQVEVHDDLVGVAGMRQDQKAKLVAAGITTLEQLAKTSLDKVESLNSRTYANLRAQAEVQYRTRNLGPGAIPVVDIVDAQALSAMPVPNDGDIFFDFEGDPLYQEGNIWNLDYLFGYVDSSSEFTPIWAHNLQQEKEALVKFINELKSRVAQYPGMHVYHYAPYEKTHLLSLAARHGVGEEFVDDLLRDNVLVDLYPIVKQAARIGSRSYSLKKLEPLFMGEEERKGVATASDSVVEYALYCQLVDQHDLTGAQAKLADIEQYNAYDCRATLALRNWLMGKATEYGVVLRGAEVEFEEISETEQDPLYTDLMELIEGFPVSERTSDHTAIALTAAAIEFHRREKKTFWWEHYNRTEAPIEEWQDTKDVFVINGCRLEREWHLEGKQTIPRRHILLDTTPGPGSTVRTESEVYLLYPPACEGLDESPVPGGRRVTKAKIIDIVSDSVLLVAEMLPGNGNEHSYVPEALTPGPPPNTDALELAIQEWGTELLESFPNFPRNSAMDILRRISPLETALTPLKTVGAHEVISGTIQEIEASYLAVQGPPGAGKSFNGGHVIADLVMNKGWKVGVIAQSHATVENLLRSVHKAGVPITQIAKALKTGDKAEEVRELEGTTWTVLPKKEFAKFLSENPASVVGGTVWDFANQSRFARQSLDLLVIDEAGQFSLANTIAASVASKRLLLLGDPQQLPQVTQGTHPEPIDGSALGWLAGEDEVLSPSFGYFLPSSYRMNEEVCSVVSSNWYDSKLGSAAPSRMLEGVAPGVFPTPVTHTGNSTSSEEEAATIVGLVGDLLSKDWTEGGVTKPLGESKENVIVVAPYNAQVQLIRKRLDEAGFTKIPVGTVDKFQGQEAAVAIVSMSASSSLEVPRGIEFLMMPNRLNVAISRAKWAAYLVYSPSLLDYRPTNVENLRLLSKFISLVGGNG